MKRSWNFGGRAVTQRKRVTTSAVADVMTMFLTPEEIEQMRHEHQLKRKNRDGRIPPPISVRNNESLT